MSLIFEADDTALRAAIPLEAKYVEGIGEVEGYGATFGGAPDMYGDIIAPGAFSESLAQHKASGSMPAMLWAHDQKHPIGKWTSATEDSRGLRVVGKLNLASAAGQQAHAHLKHGDISGLSIGFSPGRGGRERHADGTATLKRASLHEISVVTIPANRSSRVLQVKSAGTPLHLGSRGELEDLLISNGLSRGAARKIATKGWAGLVSGEDEPSAVSGPAIAAFIRKMDAGLLELKQIRGSKNA